MGAVSSGFGGRRRGARLSFTPPAVLYLLWCGRLWRSHPTAASQPCGSQSQHLVGRQLILRLILRCFMGNWRGRVPASLPWHPCVGSGVWFITLPASQGLSWELFAKTDYQRSTLGLSRAGPVLLWDLILVGPDSARCSSWLDLGGRQYEPTVSMRGASNWPKRKVGTEWSLIWIGLWGRREAGGFSRDSLGGFWLVEGGRYFLCAVGQVVG